MMILKGLVAGYVCEECSAVQNVRLSLWERQPVLLAERAGDCAKK